MRLTCVAAQEPPRAAVTIEDFWHIAPFSIRAFRELRFLTSQSDPNP